MTLKQKASLFLLPFVVLGMVVTGGHIADDLMTYKPKTPTSLKWKIIVGYSGAYTNMIGISLVPLPETNQTPSVLYFNPSDVMVIEINDEGKTFTFKYVILTNNATLR